MHNDNAFLVYYYLSVVVIYSLIKISLIRNELIVKNYFRLRNKPYPCSGVKVHLPASVYELRPRKNNKTYGVFQFNDPAKELAPNSVALIGSSVSICIAFSLNVMQSEIFFS